MADIFRFKQFSVDQSGCAMKINTDGVLLGALAQANDPKNILDIGTGTGVIALMLAQRLIDAQIDAVEIDKAAAQTAGANFKNSAFSNRLAVYPESFESFFNAHQEIKYNLIVSNPPFYINSLESPKAKKTVAKHTDKNFFEILIKHIAGHLTEDGVCWLILPLETSTLVKMIAEQVQLYPQKVITIHSFENSEPHREIICFRRKNKQQANEQLVIYDEPKVYSKLYQDTLKDFLTIF